MHLKSYLLAKESWPAWDTKYKDEGEVLYQPEIENLHKRKAIINESLIMNFAFKNPEI